MISATKEATIFPKAPHITTQTAKSTTFPLRANDLKSSIIFFIQKKLITKLPPYFKYYLRLFKKIKKSFPSFIFVYTWKSRGKLKYLL